MAEPVKTPEALAALRNKARESLGLANDSGKTILLVGMASCGLAAGAKDVYDTLLSEIQKQNLDDETAVVATGCAGMCHAEPIVEVRCPGLPPVRYGHVSKERAKSIIVKHVMQGVLLDNAVVGGEHCGNGGPFYEQI